jgi:hypothetical protein
MPTRPQPDSLRNRRALPALAGVAFAAVATGIGPMPAGTPDVTASARTQERAGESNCVAIGTPKPTAVYTYRLTQSTGIVSRYTQQWETVTTTGSKVRVSGPKRIEIQTNQHRIVNDAMVLDRSTKTNANGVIIDATTFTPGIVGDPAFRACAGRSWQIHSVTASYQSGATKASSATPAGTLRIVAIREKVTVPAGTFDAVHYVRTSQSTDEYWKSIDHGVVVKHIAVLPMGRVIDELIAIK